MKLSIKFKADDLVKIFNDAMRKVFSQANMAKWMQETADDIKKRTRLGYGVESDLQSKKPLKKLSDSYKKFRKKNPNNELSDKTAPAKSNLTYSGQMLDALRGESKGPGQGTIFLVDTRRKLKNQSRSFGNNDLAVWNAEKGRNFLAVSDLEYKRLIQKIEKELTATIRRAFKK